ncbi:hypothetical protein Tco_0183637 [Tanacetum coccineum]
MNGKKTINYTLKPVTSAYLKWRELPYEERHAYSERLSRLQQKNFGTPRVLDWYMFNNFSYDETLRDLMKMEYTHKHGDKFVDYSWERAFSIKEYMYPEWCFKFFSTMYFERKVDITKIIKEKCIWFRLCGEEHVFTLPKIAVIPSLYEPSELKHRLFPIHFNNLEINDKGFDHNEYWKRIGEPTKQTKGQQLLRTY